MLRPLLLALTLAFTIGGAQAAEPSMDAFDGDVLPPYDRLDVNHDGIVTLPEIVVIAPALAERIRHCDTDRDDKMSREEYAACKLPAASASSARHPAH